MMNNKTLAVLAGMVILAGCAPQSPAPVISGYNGKLVEERQPMVPEARLQEQTGLVASASPLDDIEPAAGSEVLAPVRPAAGAQVQMVQHRVLANETVYGLARRYETSANEILRTNGLQATSDIRPGQVLKIPANSKPSVSAWEQMKEMLTAQTAGRPAAPAPQIARVVEPAKPKVEIGEGERYSLSQKKIVVTEAPAEPAKEVVKAEKVETPVAKADAAVKLEEIEPAAGVAPQKNNADVVFVDHKVMSGETIYRISKDYDASVLDIMSANAFDKPQDLKAGTIVKVPVNQKAAVKNTAEDGVVVRPALVEGTKPVLIKPEPVQEATASQVKVEDAKGATEIAGQSSEDNTAVKTAEEKLLSPGEEIRAELKRGQVDEVAAKEPGKVWPVRGEILKKFGEEGNGVAHTGINIAVPLGTPVLATDAGTVLYADEGLKTYGKLVLISHSNGMVSAYAHNSHLLVRKGEKVKKGQVIAASGASGNVDKPQLHFELRKHASALDPIRELPKL